MFRILIITTSLVFILKTNLVLSQSKQPTLEETVNWLVNKLNTYSYDDILDISYTEDPRSRTTRNDGVEHTVFKERKHWLKPRISYDLINDKIIWSEAYTSDYLESSISKNRYNELDKDRQAAIKFHASWSNSAFSEVLTYKIPIQSLAEVTFDPNRKVLGLYTIGDVITNSYAESLDHVETYFNVNAETNLYNRLNNAIKFIREQTKVKEVF